MGAPGGSGGRAWRTSSACQPFCGVYSMRRETSKLSSRRRSSASALRGSRGCPSSSRSSTGRDVLGPPGIDAEATVPPAPREANDPFEKGDPHVELDLLRHAHAVIEQVGEAVAAPGPGLDLEANLPVLALGAEVDLARLEVPGQRHEAKRARGHVDDPHRTVPRPRHSNDEL